MNAQKLTQKSVEAVQRAQELSIERQNMQLEQAHLLLALLTQENGLIPQLLTKMDVDAEGFAAAAESAVNGIPHVSGPGREAGKIYVSEDLDHALSSAEKNADNMKDEYVSVEHLFLGLLDTADSTVKPLFSRYGITREQVLKSLVSVRGNTRVTSDAPEASL